MFARRLFVSRSLDFPVFYSNNQTMLDHSIGFTFFFLNQRSRFSNSQPASQPTYNSERFPGAGGFMVR